MAQSEGRRGGSAGDDSKRPANRVIAGQFLDDAFTEEEWNQYVEEDLKRYGESSGRPTDEELGMSKSLAELLLPSRRIRKTVAVILAVITVFLLAAPVWDFGRYLTGDPVKATVSYCEETTAMTSFAGKYVLGRERDCVLEWGHGDNRATAQVREMGLTKGDRVKVRIHGGEAYRSPQVTTRSLLGIGALIISVWLMASLRRKPQD